MKKERSYIDSVHFAGRLWILGAALIMILYPIAVSTYFDAWPTFQSIMKGAIGVVPVFWTAGAIEIFTYVPMLGAGGSYLGFVTGNLSNLKVPCALNAMEAADVKPGSEEGEIISSIAIAVSSIATTVIIAIGVVLIVPLTPILNSPILTPAFDNILPALFGSLAVVYLSKYMKVAAVPLAFMMVVFIAAPGLASSVAIFVPIGALLALASARILYKKGKI